MGGFAGWLGAKLFSKENTYLLSIVLVTNEKFTFSTTAKLERFTYHSSS